MSENNYRRPYGGPEYWEQMCRYGHELIKTNIKHFGKDAALSPEAVKFDQKLRTLGAGLIVGEIIDLSGVSIDLLIGGINPDEIEAHLDYLTEWAVDINKHMAPPEVTYILNAYVTQYCPLTMKETTINDVKFKILRIGIKFGLVAVTSEVYDAQAALVKHIDGQYRNPEDATD